MFNQMYLAIEQNKLKSRFGGTVTTAILEILNKHLFDAGMISEQAMARTLYMIKELTDKLDAYGVEPS